LKEFIIKETIGGSEKKFTALKLTSPELPKNVNFGKGSCEIIVFGKGHIPITDFTLDSAAREWNIGKICYQTATAYDSHLTNVFLPKMFKIRFEVCFLTVFFDRKLPDQHHGPFLKLVSFLDHFRAILGTLLKKRSQNSPKMVLIGLVLKFGIPPMKRKFISKL
jgi:hypothetical protein